MLITEVEARKKYYLVVLQWQKQTNKKRSDIKVDTVPPANPSRVLTDNIEEIVNTMKNIWNELGKVNDVLSDTRESF